MLGSQRYRHLASQIHYTYVQEELTFVAQRTDSNFLWLRRSQNGILDCSDRRWLLDGIYRNDADKRPWNEQSHALKLAGARHAKKNIKPSSAGFLEWHDQQTKQARWCMLSKKNDGMHKVNKTKATRTRILAIYPSYVCGIIINWLQDELVKVRAF